MAVPARVPDRPRTQAQGVGAHPEARKTGRAATKADVVLVLLRGGRQDGPGKGRAGVEQVHRRRPGREFEFSRLNTDHMEGHGRPVGLRQPCIGIVVGRRLRRCLEGDVDHRADPHAVVLLQGERGQDLVGFRGVGQVAGDEGEGRYRFR
jgi:hypothetical protein